MSRPNHRCRLVSRRGHVFAKFALLAEDVAHSIRAMHAVLDGEIVCLEPGGRSHFYQLLFRRDWPYFLAFDRLSVDGEDLRDRPLLERKRRLRAIMPRMESRRAARVDDFHDEGLSAWLGSVRAMWTSWSVSLRVNWMTPNTS